MRRLSLMFALLAGCAPKPPLSYERAVDLIDEPRWKWWSAVDYHAILWIYNDGFRDKTPPNLDEILARYGITRVTTCPRTHGCGSGDTLIQLPRTRRHTPSLAFLNDPELRAANAGVYIPPTVDPCSCDSDWYHHPYRITEAHYVASEERVQWWHDDVAEGKRVLEERARAEREAEPEPELEPAGDPEGGGP